MDITSHVQQNTLLAKCRGKFTFADHEIFREILQRMSVPEVRVVMIDLRDVDFLDSAAMGMLLLARDEASKQKKELSLHGAQGQVKKMFDLASFHSHFNIT